MAIFAVLADNPNAELGKRIESLYPTDFYKLTESQWLVMADTIPRTLSEQLDVRAGKFGRVIVLRTEGRAAGFHASSVWEWIRQKNGDA